MISIKNVFYMLFYAFSMLKEGEYKKLATEDFCNMADLFAAILIRGISLELKRGLNNEYILKKENRSLLRGQIKVTESINKLSMINRKMVCSYALYSNDTYINQILKTTLIYLRKADIKEERKKEIKSILLKFQDISTLNVKDINWNVSYNKGNRNTQLLVSVCYLIFKGMILKSLDGKLKVKNFIDDDRMNILYEKFILEYFRQEYKDLEVSNSHISWALDDDNDYLLPIMKSDTIIRYQNKVLIIDAKFYTKIMQENFGVSKINNGNLYQMFAYVKNMAVDKNKTVAGIIMYAKTDEKLVPDNNYLMMGNEISVKNLDLNCNFPIIAEQLDAIVLKYFGNLKKKHLNYM